MMQTNFTRRMLFSFALLIAASLSVTNAAEPAQKIKVWPDKPPGEARELPPEADLTKPNEGMVAGKRVIRLGNVSTPEFPLYPAPADKANGTGVVICPGGGHSILAWDLEGTEVAEWLNSQGVTALVLKYR